jgi:hypothetical protein
MNNQQEVALMFKFFRERWAEAAALSLMNLAWQMAREYVYRNEKDKVDEAIDATVILAVRLAHSHRLVRDTLLKDSSELPDDKDLLNEMKSTLAKSISAIDKKLND